jgi:hypothetical protein
MARCPAVGDLIDADCDQTSQAGLVEAAMTTRSTIRPTARGPEQPRDRRLDPSSARATRRDPRRRAWTSNPAAPRDRGSAGMTGHMRSRGLVARAARRALPRATWRSSEARDVLHGADHRGAVSGQLRPPIALRKKAGLRRRWRRVAFVRSPPLQPLREKEDTMSIALRKAAVVWDGTLAGGTGGAVERQRRV